MNYEVEIKKQLIILINNLKKENEKNKQVKELLIKYKKLSKRIKNISNGL